MKSIKTILILASIFFLLFNFIIKEPAHSASPPSVPPYLQIQISPRCIAINPLTDQAVVTDFFNKKVSVIDLNTQNILSTITLSKMPLGITIDQDLNLAVVSHPINNSISVISLDSFRVVKTISVGMLPVGISVDLMSHKALVSNFLSGSVSVIDLRTLARVGTISVGSGPVDVAIDSERRLALVANALGNKVSVIDLVSSQVVRTVTVGLIPVSVSINPETHLAGVVNLLGNSLTVINLQNWETRSISVGAFPLDVAINSLDNRALIICDLERKAVLVDLNTDTIVNEYAFNNKRFTGVAVNPYMNIGALVDDTTGELTLISLPNPVPAITSISPDTILRGSPATNVTIEGSGFIKASAVSNFQVNFIANHHLEIELSVGLLANAGTYEIVVTNPAPNGGSSNSVNLKINNPVPALTALNPTEATAGTQGLTLNVFGIGFFSDTLASINGMVRGFTLIDHTKIQTPLIAQDLDFGKYLDITAFNPPPGGGSSNALRFTVLNLAPMLTSIEPTSIIAGSPDFTLTLNGDSFVKTSIVSFNGQPVVSTYVSKTQLQATIPATAITTPGSYSVKVVNPIPGGGESSPLTFSVLNPVPSLSSINPSSVIAGSPGFTLTLNGDNFLTTSIVSFNNQQYPATYLSKTRIEATIPSSAITNPGSYPVKVINPAPGGGETSSLTFRVESSTPPVGPQPEGSFGEQYQDLIPPDVTIQSYDPKRFSLITGLVKDLGGSAIANVSVNILGRMEYGNAKTNAEGRFSIPVEGGGTLTVTYKKDGLITAHRKVYVPWNDIAITETIEMVPEDMKATTLTFDGNPSTVLTHQGTIVMDDRGSRSSTVVLTGDNRAYSVDASGNVIQELTSIITRATEFATENSMPAKLPPNSAYTYCVELSVDGAQRVRFDKPVITWVDNFLGFNVGEVVPVGYYDRDRGVWVPSDNGKVVRLLDTNGDGIVDALDSNGDGQPDDLNGNGSFSDEVVGLNDPQRYPAGSTFWRVAVTHFTPWDCNWPYGPPADATAPNPQGVPDADQQKSEEDDCRRSASVIEERSRIFHEDIPIPGTDITLHYASNRVKGFQQAVTVPASGNTVPSSLKKIIVQLNIAGRSFEQIFDPLPNRQAVFIWDGLNHLGSPVNGPITARVSIGFVYNAVYLSAGNFAQAFAQAGSQVTGIWARQEVISWKRNSLVLSQNNEILVLGKGMVAEGWTLSKHHSLNLMDISTLFKGDGTIAKNNVTIIETIAGNGNPGYSGDGGPATEAMLDGPGYMTVDASGNLYMIVGNRIRKVDTNGIITTVVNALGTLGYIEDDDGGPAIDATLSNPSAITVDSRGNLYIADTGINRIRKVDTNGIINTIAGSSENWWERGFGGDGGPANQAILNIPNGVAVDKEGNLYIADTGNFRIRKVDSQGIIATIAGIGNEGGCGNRIDDPNGDGGPALLCQFCLPLSINVDDSGNLYIIDAKRIRKVDTSGIIDAVAGAGLYSYSGDGGPAIDAGIDAIAMAVDILGNLFVADYFNHRIRMVNTNGIITTVAGSKSPMGYGGGFSGDGGPAAEALLQYPIGVATDTARSLYVADSWNYRIRKVASPSVFASLTTAGEIPFAEENGMGYILSSAGRHKSTIDLDTGRTLYTFGYDQNKNLISITDQFGNQTTIQRNASGVPTAIVSPDGLTTTLTIDSNNHLTRITYPGTNFYSFECKPDGLMTAKVEPEGNRFEHTFDPAGRLTDANDQEGGSWQYSRSVYTNGDIQTQVLSAEGNLTTYLDRTDSTGAYTSRITDASGTETLYARSADKLTATKSLPCGMNLTFKYGIDSQYKFEFVKEMREKAASGLEKITLREKTYQDTNADKIPDLITEKITLNGKLIRFITNTLQSKRTLTSPVGRTTTTFYDPNNLLTTKLTIPGLYDTNFGYDTRGRLTSINTDIRETTFTYDAQGNLSSVTDPENRTTSYSYDAVGRMTGILRPDSSSVSFTYDKNGNMTILTNPATINHGFGYNKVNFESSYQTPLGGSYSYLYNRDRRLAQINLPSGKQIRNIYDKDRIIQTQTPEGNIDFTYLCGSKVGSIAKGTEIITRGYDGSLVTSESLSGTLNQSLNYTYNSDFNVRQFTYAGGSVNYTYDNDGFLTGSGAFTITRNAGNGLPGAVTGGALNLSRTFNGYGEVESQNFAINGLNLTSWGLTRDKNGRIVSKAETTEGTTSNFAYTYDPMGRLLTVTKDGTLVEEYQYDSVGRRTYEMNVLKGISGRTYAYSDEDHLLTAGDITYQYDPDGFLTNKTQGSNITRYNYSSKGELLSVILPDGRVIEYVNDPIGRRIAKKVDGVITEKYLWQGLTRLLAVYDGTNNLVMRFEYADARMPVTMTKSGINYYLTYDQVGSLRTISDSSGNVIKRVDYDSFGSIINDTTPGFTIPFGFAGGLHDRDTGLVRFGFRDYDPETGRWTAKDPIGLAGGDADLYGYCLGDPINRIDPLGVYVWPYSWKGWTGITLVSAGAALTAAGMVPAGLILAGAGAGFLIWEAIEGPIKAAEDTEKKLEPLKKELEELEKLEKELELEKKPCPTNKRR